MKIIERLYDKKVDGSGLALFRIAYSAVLFCEVAQLFYFRHLVFDKIPFLEPAEIDLTYGLIVWMIAIIFLMIGFFSRISSILNYALSVVLISAIDSYEYHMFYVYMGVNFLLMFVNTSQVNSIDRLREKLKCTSTGFIPARTVSVLNYYVIVIVAIAFVYLDSVFWKLLSHNWMSGIGMWLPASLVFMTYRDFSELLDLKWVVIGFGYLTFIFETVFIFLFFRRKWRIPLFIIGTGLHLGIAFVFPIPWFGLGVTAIYILLVPVYFWRRIHNAISFSKPRITFFYKEDSEVSCRLMIILKHFDFLKALSINYTQNNLASEMLPTSSREIYSVSSTQKLRSGIDAYLHGFRFIPLFFIVGLLLRVPGIYHLAKWIYQRETTGSTSQSAANKIPNVPLYVVNSDYSGMSNVIRFKNVNVFLITVGIALLMLLQLISSYQTPLMMLILHKIKFEDTYLDVKIKEASAPIRVHSRALLGVTNHPVFLDSHFAGYNHVIAVEAIDKNGNREWLPIVDKYGSPDFYNYGFGFVKWTYRVNGPMVNQSILIKGIRDFSTFWSFQNKKDMNEVRFKVYVKKIYVPTAWEVDLLKKQKDAPWIECGDAYWQNKVFTADICEIESL